jgi:hypothetical protein
MGRKTEVAEDADDTPKKMLVDWLVGQYITENLDTGPVLGLISIHITVETKERACLFAK